MSADHQCRWPVGSWGCGVLQGSLTCSVQQPRLVAERPGCLPSDIARLIYKIKHLMSRVSLSGRGCGCGSAAHQ